MIILYSVYNSCKKTIKSLRKKTFVFLVKCGYLYNYVNNYSYNINIPRVIQGECEDIILTYHQLKVLNAILISYKINSKSLEMICNYTDANILHLVLEISKNADDTVKRISIVWNSSEHMYKINDKSWSKPIFGEIILT